MKWNSFHGVVHFVILTATLLAPTIASTAHAAGSAGGPMLTEALEGPLGDVDEIVFAVRAPGRDGHWYANFGYWASNEQSMMYGPDGGRLMRLNLRTGRTKVILDDPAGGVRDPQVHYDGNKILQLLRLVVSRPSRSWARCGWEPPTRLHRLVCQSVDEACRRVALRREPVGAGTDKGASVDRVGGPYAGT